ncbi:hypothetical protein M231_06365 [Tremella mesenterica]|uniref:RFX-type winged-helix domain-containing protein n=1 Tax=Tremella mesenterica TaxID=5217 RepID=A0A4Q1BC68_TREME|nr:hypothetical protein M231_06365 [Tremella mesenterica]
MSDSVPGLEPFTFTNLSGPTSPHDQNNASPASQENASHHPTSSDLLTVSFPHSPEQHDMPPWPSSLTPDETYTQQNSYPPAFNSYQGTGSSDHVNVGYAPSVFETPSHPHYMLSHASSTSSLNSLSSFSAAPSMASSGLFVQAFPHEQMPMSNSHSHSRHSSISSLSGLEDKSMFSQHGSMLDMSFQMPQGMSDMTGSFQSQSATSTPFRYTPKLELQTHGLGRAIGRTRSSSRATPYHRNRSDSVSAKSEDEDLGDLLSAASSQNPYMTQWGSGNALAGGFGKMTLHHRRTSSNTSNMSAMKTSPRPMLSRAKRSSSLALRKQASFDLLSASDIKLVGSAAEREEMVRRDLTQKAEQVKCLPATSQQDKARALWVKRWLNLSYTTAAGYTVPRQGLYHSYTVSCDEYGLKPINSASFGKAVRSAFAGIKTRRLGVRGNSKYHYVSLRPAIRVEAERLNAYGDSSGWASSHNGVEEDMEGEDVDDTEFDDDDDVFSRIKRSPSSNDLSNLFNQKTNRPTSLEMAQRPRSAFMRRHTTSTYPTIPSASAESNELSGPPLYTLPGFPSLQDVLNAAPHLPVETTQNFWSSFSHHLDILASCVRGLHFDRYELNCRTFWSNLSPASLQAASEQGISNLVSVGYAVAYDHMVSVLLSKVLAPLSANSQNSLRALSQNLESIMEESLRGFPREFCEDKFELTVRVAHLFIRFIDLHQLTAALSPILANQDQVRSMLNAWENLDMSVISDQCALSANCQQDVLEGILREFHRWLLDAEASPNRGGKAIERLGQWIDGVLHDLQHGSEMAAPMPLRALVPRAGFITSQVMRDFTLKSDPSFGLFQLVKTWIDDWISIHALRQTALSPNSVQVQSLQTNMSVIIPSQGPDFVLPDLNTAVPYHFNNGMEYSNGAQYLSMPSFEGNSVTPRPLFGTDHQQQQQQQQ